MIDGPLPGHRMWIAEIQPLQGFGHHDGGPAVGREIHVVGVVDISVQASGKDLMLGFNVLVENLQEVPDGVASVYTLLAQP